MVLGAKNAGATFSGKNGQIPHSDNPRYYRLDFITGAPGGDITLIHSPARITSRRGEQIYESHSGSEEKHPSFHLINDGIV